MAQRSSFCISFLFLISCVLAFAENLPPPESPPVIKASDTLPSDMVQGAGYTVDSNVSTEGYLCNFTMHTNFGPMKIRGIDLLQIRISEVPAMQELDKVSKTEVFAKSMANAAVKPLKSIQKAAENPVETVKGIPSGIGRFFKKTAKVVEEGVDAAKASDKKSGETSSSSSAIKELAGLNKTKREWAKKLQVDPYTTNPVLKKQLDDIALATFAGGLTVKVTRPKPPGPIRRVVRISNLVWDMPPEDLEELNKKKMKTMGISEEDMKAFLKNPHLTPTMQTAIVSAVEQLPAVAGRSRVIIPASFESEEEVRFFLGSLLLLENYHRSNPIQKLQTSGSVIAGTTSRGILVIAVDLDYIPWTAEVKEFSQRKELSARDRRILISGKLSPRTKKGLALLGWQFQENYTVR